MTEITPSILQPNLVPIDISDINIQEGMAIDGTPAANTPATPPADLNIQVSANGSVMSIGNLQSTNFHAGSAGWRLDSNGNIEANDGNFRGDISGASGTFSGTVSAATVLYNKTSFTDSVNAGYYISSDGLYFGSASDTGFLKYTVATGTLEIKDFKITSLAANSSIDGQYLGNLSVATGALANLAVTAGKIDNATITATQIAGNTITAAEIAGLTITASEIANNTITAGQITAATITTTEIAANTIDAGNIAALTITASEIANNTITAGQITNSTITTDQIAANTIVAGNIAASTITTSEISGTAGIVGGQIDNLTIVAGNIANLTITAAQIAAATITGAKVVQNTITGGATGNIALTSIVAGNIAAATITGTEIAATTIAAGNIAANTITANELAADSVTATEINVATLSAIAADLGTITAGNITLDTSGYIKGGQTAYNTGTGFFLGYDTDAYKFSLGVSTGSYLIWNGINLEISGKIKAESIEWKGRTIIPVFESLDGWITSIDSDGSITPYVGTVEVTPGTTTDDVTELHIEGASENITMTNNPFFQATIKVGDITYQDMEICSGYSAFAPAYGTRFGFRWSATDNKLYAFHYASSSETKTEMTGISMEGYVNHYRAEMSDGGDTIKFYVNGVLKATHTNADCGVDTSILISMGGKNISGQNGIYFSNLIFAQDF